MHIDRRIKTLLQRSIALPAILLCALAAAQPHPASPSQPPAATAPVSDRDFVTTQSELIKLLRLSPTLTTVVARDPSLLSNQDYVSRNNPQLAQFLAAHPEIARNPDFYLFTRVHREDGGNDEALERAVWPEFSQPRHTDPLDIIGPLAAFLAFACFLCALVWIIRQILENRRWGRMFKLQSEVHGRLIDKFSTTQELAAYMSTEAGKRFLEAAPISAGIEPAAPRQPRHGTSHAYLRNRGADAWTWVYHLRSGHLGPGGASRPHARQPRVHRQIALRPQGKPVSREAHNRDRNAHALGIRTSEPASRRRAACGRTAHGQ